MPAHDQAKSLPKIASRPSLRMSSPSGQRRQIFPFFAKKFIETHKSIVVSSCSSFEDLPLVSFTRPLSTGARITFKSSKVSFNEAVNVIEYALHPAAKESWYSKLNYHAFRQDWLLECHQTPTFSQVLIIEKCDAVSKRLVQFVRQSLEKATIVSASTLIEAQAMCQRYAFDVVVADDHGTHHDLRKLLPDDDKVVVIKDRDSSSPHTMLRRAGFVWPTSLLHRPCSLASEQLFIT